MDKSLKYCLNLIAFLAFQGFVAQSYNCNVFEKENQKKACQLYNLATQYQGFRQSQEAFDKGIELFPEFSELYFEKSVPYLKNGDFITWKTLIDKAINLEPRKHLGYRAWCKFQFLRDYRGAIADFEELEKLGSNDLGYSQNGDYQLEIVKGICYSAIGEKEKAVSIIESRLSNKNNNVGLYDYYQLGVTYFELNKVDKALENFEKQSKISDFAENIYFRAKVSKIRNKDYLDLKNLALKTYDEGKTMKDSYTHHYNKIYRQQIADL